MHAPSGWVSSGLASVPSVFMQQPRQRLMADTDHIRLGGSTLKSARLLAAPAGVMCLLAALSAHAEVPQMINYQGRLTDGAGEPLDTTVSMEFAIYDDSTGGVLKWAEAHPSVVVEGGIFSVILGASVPIDDSVFNQPDRWLGITVGTDPELMSRTRLVSVGYSHRVSTVDGATGGIISGDVSIQSDLVVSGKATIGPGHTNSGTYAFVAGENNEASGDRSTVGGGSINHATGEFSTIVGGGENSAGGDYSAVLGGRNNTITSDSHYSYLFGIGSQLTQGSTFMVHMPHIRFGNEATGYEFPVADGNADQVMATDGSGQLGWTSLATGDNDWVFGAAPNDDVLFTGGQWGLAREGNVLYGADDDRHINLGKNCTTGTEGYDYYYIVVCGGNENVAAGMGSAVGGGHDNWTDSSYACIVGGTRNTVDAEFSFIGCGKDNEVLDSLGVVTGGYNNTISAGAHSAVICGGRNNDITGKQSAIVGGGSNRVDEKRSFVGGGSGNNVLDSFSVICGGESNTIAAGAHNAAICGGYDNAVEAAYSAILGGYSNTITSSAEYSYLFGNNSTLTQASTFMVDMPHIRFGDETDGYEFPASDGIAGQMLMTDGDGQLFWVSSPLACPYSETCSVFNDLAFEITNNAWGGDGACFTGTSGMNGLGNPGVRVTGISYAAPSAGGIGVAGYVLGSDGGTGGEFIADLPLGTGVYARGDSRAGHFDGDVDIIDDLVVGGNISKGSGGFRIDHPLDPENKYLYHSFVESPDMKNVYDGIAVLNDNGEAIVELPEYFEAVNRDFRYQLTCMGGYAPVYIAKEIADNRFAVAGGVPGMKVSWQVTGIRRDGYAEANRIVVEVDKPEKERGLYLHPEAYGYGEEYGIGFEERQKRDQ